MPSAPRLLFVGSATVDMIFAVDALPVGSGKVLPQRLVQAAHGMATSAAIAAARLGGSVSLAARIGDDPTGALFLSEVTSEGVDCRYVRRTQGVPTPVSAVIVNGDGDRLVIPYYDLRLDSSVDWIEDTLLDGFDAVEVDVRWPAAAARILQLARDKGKIGVLDGDTGPTEVLVELAGLASHCVFSEPAAYQLSCASSIPEALNTLAQRFSGFVAITAGAEGCYWMENGAMRLSPAPTVNAVDTLAAGDVFHGAFTLAIAEGQRPEDAIAFANAAAAIKCTIFGGRLGAPDRAAVEALLAKN